MKYKQTATRSTRTALALVVTALAVTSFSGVSYAEGNEPAEPQEPASSAENSNSFDTSYWTGEYWDAQKGSSFWHNLIPGRSTASNPVAPDTVNGSKRVRDLQRARARAAAKAQR